MEKSIESSPNSGFEELHRTVLNRLLDDRIGMACERGPSGPYLWASYCLERPDSPQGVEAIITTVRFGDNHGLDICYNEFCESVTDKLGNTKQGSLSMMPVRYPNLLEAAGHHPEDMHSDRLQTILDFFNNNRTRLLTDEESALPYFREKLGLAERLIVDVPKLEARLPQAETRTKNDLLTKICLSGVSAALRLQNLTPKFFKKGR